MHITHMSSSRRPARAQRVIAGTLCASAALAISGCGVETADGPVDVAVDVRSDPSGSGVIIVAIGAVCDDVFAAEAHVDRHTKVISVTGHGSLPDNEFQYCSRYIDTGGEGPITTERRLPLALDPGTYQLRGSDGDELEFRFRDGMVESSLPYSSLSVKAQRAPQRDATSSVAARLQASLPAEWPRFGGGAADEVDCTPDDGEHIGRPRLTATCNLYAPDEFVTDVGVNPFPRDALAALGCPTPTVVGDGHELTCELDPMPSGSTLHVRGASSDTSRSGMPVGWYWDRCFVVWVEEDV